MHKPELLEGVQQRIQARDAERADQAERAVARKIRCQLVAVARPEHQQPEQGVVGGAKLMAATRHRLLPWRMARCYPTRPIRRTRRSQGLSQPAIVPPCKHIDAREGSD